jgi:hypothetical protein
MPVAGGNDRLILTSLELLDQIAVLVLHHGCTATTGCWRPTHPLRLAVTALAVPAAAAPPNPAGPADEPAHGRVARYTRAPLLARICWPRSSVLSL